MDLEGKTFEEVCQIAEDFGLGNFRTTYISLNPGLQRMNVGNRIKSYLKRQNQQPNSVSLIGVVIKQNWKRQFCMEVARSKDMVEAILMKGPTRIIQKVPIKKFDDEWVDSTGDLQLLARMWYNNKNYIKLHPKVELILVEIMKGVKNITECKRPLIGWGSE